MHARLGSLIWHVRKKKAKFEDHVLVKERTVTF